MTKQHIEVITSVERRRRWSREEKERLVAASLEPGVSSSEVARSAGIHVSQLFRWRKELCQISAPSVPQFIPVEVVAALASRPIPVEPPPAPPGRARRASIVTIELGGGRRIRVESDVDTEALRPDPRCGGAAMIPVPSGVKVWLATGHTDMRKGFPGLSLMVQETLKRDPHSGHLFCFRGRQGDLIKVIWHDGQGACLFTKKLERGRFVWPSAADGTVVITPAQLGYLLEGIDWRMPQKTWRPSSAG